VLTVNKLVPQGQGLASVLLKRAATVNLDWDARQKSRFDATDSSGRPLGVFLPRGSVVRGGDVLICENGSLIRVNAAVQAVMVVRPCAEHGSTLDLLRAAYHLGNRHVQLELQADHLKLEPDPALADLLRDMHLSVTEEQVLSANIDTAFIVSGLDGEYNLRRLERYVSVAWDSGTSPVVLLNKSDLRHDVDEIVSEVESTIIGVPVHSVSALIADSLEILNDYFGKGKTVSFLGSSGVGKSTIINSLLGYDRQKTGEVRESDSRGRHTTTYRELIALPEGGVLIDTPGMREIEIWGEQDGLSKAFDDIEELATRCRFNDCGHGSEPGCAVKEALDSGELDSARYQNYLKLQKELRRLALRKMGKEAHYQKMQGKKFASMVKEVKKLKNFKRK